MNASSKKSYGSIPQTRARNLLGAILSIVVNDDRNSGLRFNADWDERVTIETTLKNLVLLVHPTLKTNTNEFKRAKTQVRDALGDLRDFVGILDDHRTQKKGSDQWHFSLKLWGREVDRNLTEFDKLWESKRSPKSQPKPVSEINSSAVPGKDLESPIPKISSSKSSQTTSGNAHGTQVNAPQGPVIVGSNPIVNINLPKHREESSKKTILMVPATSESSTSSRWRGELRTIRKAVENATSVAERRAERSVAKYDFTDRPDIISSDLSQNLTTLEPYVIHIFGYAEGISELVVENIGHHENQNKLIADLFNLHSKFIICIVLSGCYLEEQVREISQYIEFIIAIPKDLAENSAIKFINEFYFHLASNNDVELSFKLGQNLLQRGNISEKSLFPSLFYKKDEIDRRYLEKELEKCIDNLAKSPNNIDLLNKKARLLKDLGRIEETDETYDEIADIDPNNYENRVKQGDDLDELGDYEKAGNAYTKALELKEKDYRVWWKKAITLVKSGHIMEAGMYYKKALSLLPPYSSSIPCPDKYVISKEYGDILIETNRHCEGVQSYRTSLWLQRNYRLASYSKKQAYKKLYSQRS